MSEIQVSVIILTYNYGAYLPQCVTSVHQTLKQRGEIVFVDDGSSDLHTQLLLKSLEREYKVMYTPRKGPSYARNVGIQAARGTYILFLDADDYLHDEYIDHALARLEKTGADFYYPSYVYFGSSTGEQIVPTFAIPRLLMKNYIIITCLIKKEFLLSQKVRFDETMAMGLEDREFRISCCENGIQGVTSPIPLVSIRKHAHARTVQANNNKRILFAYIYNKHKSFYKAQLSFFQLLILRLEYTNTALTKYIVNLLPISIRNRLKGL